MGFLEEIDEIINISTNMLITNDKICRLVTLYPKSVDFGFNPLDKNKEPNKQTLLMNKVFPLPKMPDAETEQICFIDVYVDGGANYPNNSGFRKAILTFDIICHLDSWIIQGGYRPLKIASEIDKMFNDQLTNLPIGNKPFALPPRLVRYSNKFFGYQLKYEVSINNNIKCGGCNG